MSLPQTMKAYKCQGPDQAALVEAPLPKLRPDYLLLKVHAVALNPTDWKHIAGIPTPGATVGCDVSGTVLEIGPNVKKSWQKGDRVAGFAHGVNAVQPEDGAFAEYAVVKGDVSFKVPDNLSFEQAATLGVGVITVGQGVYQSLQMPSPSSPSTSKEPILIYGGSTATGLYALQYAKLSGLQVITTCSPRNFDVCKKFGADMCFDYNEQDCGSKIREATGDKLQKAFDCISTKDSAAICAAALASSLSGGDGKDYSSLLPVDLPRDNAKFGYTLGYTVVGERFTFRGGMEFPAKPEDFEFGKGWVSLAEGLLKDGKVKTIPMEVRDGGLEKVHEGLADLRNNRVSGTKIVYKVASA